MRSRFTARGVPWFTLPVDQTFGRGFGEAFPPHVAIGRHRDVREDRVTVQRGKTVRVRLLRRAWRDTERTRFRVDRIQAPVLTGLDPRDVLADRRDFPAFELLRRDEHREIRLAARAR